MKIYVMTDMEGVAGVVSSVDYCNPTASRYYEMGRELTTLEVNAAIAGAMEAGATEFLVADGHGWGAIDPVKLHPAARLLTGSPIGYPWGCDRSFDAAFVVGQHAMSNTDGGHLCHTQSFSAEEYRLNGRLFGEMAENMLFTSYFGVPTVLVTGDRACCAEATALVPAIETVAVKEGLKRGSAAGLLAEQNERFNGAAIHLHPDEARSRIRAGARLALERRGDIASYQVEGPYELTRLDRPGQISEPGQLWRKVAADLLELLEKRFELVGSE